MKLLKYTLLATSLLLSGMNHWARAEELKDTLYLDGKGEAKQLSSGTYKFNI